MTEREEPTTKNTLPSETLIQIWWRNQKLSWQANVKRIQHHQTTFTTNAKGTSLGRKHERRKIPTKNKPKTIKKLVTRLNAPITRQRLAGQMETSACVHFHWPHPSTWLPELYIIILYCQVNHVPIMACMLIVKTDKRILLLWLCNYYSLYTTASWLVNRKIIELCITKTMI